MFQTLSKLYASQLFLNIHCSSIYRNIVTVTCLLSTISIFIISADLFLFACFLSVFLFYITKQAFDNNVARELHWKPDGSWLIKENKNIQEAVLCGSSVVTRFIAILNFKLEDSKRRSVIIFKDNLSTDDFRRLRVRIKVEGIVPVARDTLG